MACIKLHIRTILSGVLLLQCLSICSQENNIILQDLFRENNKANYREKIFVHLDRQYYLVGERIWYTIYCLEQETNRPSFLSSVAYIELIDHQNQTILKKKIELNRGKGFGSFEIPDRCNSEAYFIRCYSAWQKNFGPESYYYNNLLIIHPSKPLSLERKVKKLAGFEMHFYPQGGSLVGDVLNHLVFTVFDNNQNAVELIGEIISDDSTVVTSFSTSGPGMGTFRMIPEQGKHYSARFYDANRNEVVFKLPGLKENACALELLSAPGGMRSVHLRLGQGVLRNNSFITALVWTHSGIDVIEKLEADTLIHLHVPKEKVSGGINYLTIFDESYRILGERSFYENKDNPLILRTINLDDSYNSRDIVEFGIETRNSTDLLVDSRLSVSITKSGGYNIDSHSSSFLGSMKFGNEIPELFAEPTGNISNERLDLLMIINSKDRCNWLDNDLTKIKYIPEEEGFVIGGTISDKSTKMPVHNQKVFLSFIDSIPDFYSTTSNESGRFYFSLDEKKEPKDLVIQPYGNGNDFLITLDDDFSREPIPEFRFKSLNKKYLLEYFEQLSLNQQLVDLYGLDDSKSSYSEDERVPVYGQYDHEIIMEEFIKLPVMEEVFRELGKRTLLSRKEGKYEISVLDIQVNRVIGDRPFFFIDGVPVFDSELLLALNPADIKSIKLKSRKYFVNDISMDGIVDIHTYKADARIIDLPESAVSQYFQTFTRETLFSPTSILSDPRLPIYQTTLYFDSDIHNSNTEDSQIRFIAPDSKGEYEICVIAWGEDGRLGEKRFSFMIE